MFFNVFKIAILGHTYSEKQAKLLISHFMNNKYSNNPLSSKKTLYEKVSSECVFKEIFVLCIWSLYEILTISYFGSEINNIIVTMN